MKDDKIYIDKAIEEILNPQFEITKQLLNVCELEIENDKPKITRISNSNSERKKTIYFSVKNEQYFIAVILNTEPKPEVQFVYTESGHRIYFTATSTTKTFDELSSNINLKPLTGWSIGERQMYKGKANDHTRLEYEPITNLAYDLNEKLDILLGKLESEEKGIKSLFKIANTGIQICKYQYVSGNAGIHITSGTIKRLQKLNLYVDIDTYIVGNKIN